MVTRSIPNIRISLFYSSLFSGWEPGAEARAGSFILCSLRRVSRRRRWPGCLFAPPGPWFGSREKKKLAPLARRIAGDGTLTRPRECLVHISGFQYPEAADVLLGLRVWPIG